VCCDQPWVQRDYWNNLCDVQFLQNKEGHCQLYSWKSSWSYVQLTGMFHYFSAAKHIISLYICMVANFVMWGYDKFYYIHAVIYSAYLYLNLFVILYSVSLCIPPPTFKQKKITGLSDLGEISQFGVIHRISCKYYTADNQRNKYSLSFVFRAYMALGKNFMYYYLSHADKY